MPGDRIAIYTYRPPQHRCSRRCEWEYPQASGPGREPYYPVPSADGKALYRRYLERAQAETRVSFIGRLATYRYYNMDQVVGMALNEFEKLAMRAGESQMGDHRRSDEAGLVEGETADA